MMAAQPGALRRGLPRVPGGEPWPPAGEAPARMMTATAEAIAPPVAPETTPGTTLSAPVTSVNADAGPRQLRRGLPRVPGGEPWPAAGAASVAVAPAPPAGQAAEATAANAGTDETEPAATPPAVPVPAAAAAAKPTTGGPLLRRGLPRVAGGEPWPPPGLAPTRAATPTAREAPEVTAPEPAPAASVAEAVVEPEPKVPASSLAVPAVQAFPAPAPPAPASDVVVVEKPATPKAEAKLYGSRTLAQWIKRVVLLAVGAVVAAGILVLAARGVTTLPGVPEFLKRYPGAYDPPAAAEPGFPWWAQWAHFLNIFLMVLIIRSGYQVRTQQKPPALWTPKRGGKKISITLWLHQSLDILWLANGLIFAVLLFASGRWVRLVPTSWEVFPNAASALLQYMMLDWPVESGWVNYNSLQQLMYFIVVFIAAPLAAVTGVRMSEVWPKNATTLNKAYPVEAARAVHFPTMLFFVLFIIVHVFLVVATGALRNLNHMFGGTDVVNWAGFWLFAAAIAITAAGWYAAKPLVLAAIAQLFGKVSSR